MGTNLVWIIVAHHVGDAWLTSPLTSASCVRKKFAACSVSLYGESINLCSNEAERLSRYSDEVVPFLFAYRLPPCKRTDEILFAPTTFRGTLGSQGRMS